MNAKHVLVALLLGTPLGLSGVHAASVPAQHTFAIGTNDFLLDGQRFQIRCGEVHAAARAARILAAPAADGQGDGPEHRLRLSVLEHARAAPGRVQLVRPGGRRRVLPHRAGGRAVGHPASRPVRLRRVGNGRASRGGCSSTTTSSSAPATRVISTPRSATSRKSAACSVRCKSPRAARSSWCRSRTNTASSARTPNTWANCARRCSTPASTCRCSPAIPPIALKNGYRADLFPVVNFGSDPAGGFKALREILPQGPADVRRILSRLVRHLGRAASPRQDRSLPRRPRIHAQGGRLVQHLHGARRHDLRLLDRRRPAVQARHLELRLRRARSARPAGPRTSSSRRATCSRSICCRAKPFPNRRRRIRSSRFRRSSAAECAPLFDNLPERHRGRHSRGTWSNTTRPSAASCIAPRCLPDRLATLEAASVHDFG